MTTTPQPLTPQQVEAIVADTPRRHAAILQAAHADPAAERAHRIHIITAFRDARAPQSPKEPA